MAASASLRFLLEAAAAALAAASGPGSTTSQTAPQYVDWVFRIMNISEECVNGWVLLEQTFKIVFVYDV